MQNKDLRISRSRASLKPPGIERPSGKPSAVGRRAVRLGSLALLCVACSMVNVTPLGSTHDGRRQYEITCNRLATENGQCHEQALALCGGSYETQSLGSTEPGVDNYDGQLFTRPAERVLLIACNR
jgi:hypothetical protein